MRSATAIATQSRNRVTATLRFKAPLTISGLAFGGCKATVILCHAVHPAVSSNLDGPHVDINRAWILARDTFGPLQDTSRNGTNLAI